ncbi:hypothetical protein [Hydrogenophaga electricum]|uniref:Uncharacterized protein n=1 Tax=Hydrogenophaga electricum TaxID=1230953 RepID=A0ABQ6CA24_9BURK|nr:hypothetical protein [Hydrogenophaga electricum]GLS15569.1 hypothetical protein GCM10007935_30050 [Hydrogenophaga electricum]
MFLPDTLYIQVFAHRFVASNIDSGVVREVPRDPQSVSPRMLIGAFAVAAGELSALVKTVRRGLWAPVMLMHPMERIEGGLTEVEHRVFLELGRGAGAARVGVHTGAVLAGDAVREAIRAYPH